MDDRSDIARRMETIGLAQGIEENPDLPKDPWSPRWTIKGNWIEFECGCRAEKAPQLFGAQAFDPIIFKGLLQQAVYDEVCSRHLPGMNKYVGFGAKGLDFHQWKKNRRAILMGKVR